MSDENKKKGADTLFGKFKARLQLEVGIAILSVLLVLLLNLIPFFRNLEFSGYDLRMQLKKKIPTYKGVSLLLVDDESIDKFGRWPWRRNIHAQALDLLKELSARQVVFDVEFSDVSDKKVTKAGAKHFRDIISSGLDALRSNIARLQANIRKGRARNVLLDLSDFEKAILTKKKDILANIGQLGQNDDQVFAMAIMRHGGVTIPVRGVPETNILETARHEYVLNNYGLKSNGIDLGDGIINDNRVVIPSNPLHRAPQSLAFVNVGIDPDGVRRRVALFRSYKKRLFPQLVVPSVLRILGINRSNVIVTPGSKVVFKNALLPGSKKRGDISVPIDSSGQMLINWGGYWKEKFNKFSYADLFAYIDARVKMYGIFAQLDKAFSGSGGGGTLFTGGLENYYSQFKQLVSKVKSGQLLTKVERQMMQGLGAHIYNVGIQELAHLKKELKFRVKEIKKSKGAQKKNLEKQYKLVKEWYDHVSKNNKIFSILKKRVADLVKDAVVIIGHSTSNTTDLGNTPFEVGIPQVFLHPNVLNTILQGSYIREASPLVNLFVMLLVPFLFAIATIRLRPSRIVVLGLVVFAVYFVFNFLLFALLGYWLNLVSVQIAFFITFLAITILHYLRGDKEKKFITAAFSHYLSPDVIDVLVDDPKSLKLGGERKVLTAFFSDVEGFSSISEALSPEALVDLLNEYLTDMTDIVMQQKGTVDKFEGDAIIAFYGAPVPFEDHAVRACLAAIYMQTRIDQMRPLWKEKYGHELFVRMGINTGQMVVGNMGSKTRFDYTMMGDSVNLAARLEGVNKYYGTYSMISDATYEQVKEQVAAREIDILRVIGKDEPVTVYELLGEKRFLDEQIAAKMEVFAKALAVYREKDWKAARNLFKDVLKIDKADGPAKTYVERCSKFIKSPPSASWDGVYTLRGK